MAAGIGAPVIRVLPFDGLLAVFSSPVALILEVTVTVPLGGAQLLGLWKVFGQRSDAFRYGGELLLVVGGLHHLWDQHLHGPGIDHRRRYVRRPRAVL